MARSFMELNINQNLLGQIAAIALKPDFDIVCIKPIYPAVSNDDVGDGLQQQSPHGTERPAGIEASLPIGYDIFIDYNDGFSEKNISAARFEFVVAETVTGWILRNWELL